MTLAVALLLATGSTFAEPPTLFEHWVPSGWKLISSATGDLNRDGADDAVLVVEEVSADNLFENDGFGSPVLNLNPRRLIVLLNTQSGYRTFLTRDNLLPSEHSQENPCLADPLLSEGDISIARGRILVALGTWLSCGSYGVSRQAFTFRLESEQFRLIGYDYSGFSRSTGEVTEVSVNYLTGKKKTTTGGNMFEEMTPSVSWSQISEPHQFYLEDISLDCFSSDSAGCSWYR
ncbi:hypothetical protein J7J47_08815 [Halomonas sp. ISL-60]|uniref:hypothetical protein n=1 Tax=Halomonas sp. ISL-56 TaxID=2819149 RepID=UPI001BEAEFE9|nr:hypothetical protein [Halomonas sp. ISL-56]MBT2772333.1 hypothetical protein [Halomonas sp. ISL-60]MBT2800770.1 hypothetical protein [Halomonas sp. ISL-56]